MDTPILAPQFSQSETSISDRYLRFQLDAATPAILSTEYIQEVFVIPTKRITFMPNMPDCVVGLLNLRNRIIWVIDLAQMLDLQPVDASSQQYHLIVIRVGDVPLGLIVYEIKQVTRFLPHALETVAENSSAIAPYLEGYLWQQQERLLVLSAEAIIHSPILYSY